MLIILKNKEHLITKGFKFKCSIGKNNIKLQKKKVCIEWIEPNMTLVLEPNKLKSNQMVLNTCRLISKI